MLGLGLMARYVSILVAVVLFSGTAAIAFWSHDHIIRRENVLSDHVRLVLSDLLESLEARMALGLPLAQLPEIDRLLDQSRGQLPHTVSVALVDELGVAVFSTDPVEVGERLLSPEGWRDEGVTRMEMGEEEVFWMPIPGDFGTAAGAVLLRLQAGSTRAGALSFALGLLTTVAVPVGGLLLVGAGLGMWFARRVSAPVTVLADGLAHLSAAPETADTEIPAVNGTGLPVREFARVVGARHRRLAAAEAELVRLDEMA